jgi:hypothetical protein
VKDAEWFCLTKLVGKVSAQIGSALSEESLLRCVLF